MMRTHGPPNGVPVENSGPIEKQNIFKQIEVCKKASGQGFDYWMARDLLTILGYTRWENFVNVIDKAKMACTSAGIDPGDQFRETTKVITAGKGAEIPRLDFFLA